MTNKFFLKLNMAIIFCVILFANVSYGKIDLSLPLERNEESSDYYKEIVFQHDESGKLTANLSGQVEEVEEKDGYYYIPIQYTGASVITALKDVNNKEVDFFEIEGAAGNSDNSGQWGLVKGKDYTLKIEKKKMDDLLKGKKFWGLYIETTGREYSNPGVTTPPTNEDGTISDDSVIQIALSSAVDSENNDNDVPVTIEYDGSGDIIVSSYDTKTGITTHGKAEIRGSTVYIPFQYVGDVVMSKLYVVEKAGLGTKDVPAGAFTIECPGDANGTHQDSSGNWYLNPSYGRYQLKISKSDLDLMLEGRKFTSVWFSSTGVNPEAVSEVGEDVNDDVEWYEKIISWIIRLIGIGLQKLLAIVTGDTNLSIDALVFDQYPKTNLFLFERSSGETNPLVVGALAPLNEVYSLFRKMAVTC